LYFTANWCGPCRSTTLLLTDAYTKYTSANKKNGFADETGITFVSSDRDISSFTDYHQEMSFPAVSYEKCNGIASKFGVQGIPFLTVVSPGHGQEMFDSLDVRSLIF